MSVYYSKSMKRLINEYHLLEQSITREYVERQIRLDMRRTGQNVRISGTPWCSTTICRRQWAGLVRLVRTSSMKMRQSRSLKYWNSTVRSMSSCGALVCGAICRQANAGRGMRTSLWMVTSTSVATMP